MFKLVNRLADRNSRLVLTERFEKRPLLNASILITATDPTLAQMATRWEANENFEIAGTNAQDSDVTFDAEGGIVLTTQNSDGDQMILQPHSDTTASQWNVAGLFGSENRPTYELLIRTGASIADTIIWGGLKLTSTPTVATDNDQVFFRYEDSANSGKWQLILSRGGTDETFNTDIAVAASTFYRLQIAVDADRKVNAYVNEQPINLDKKFDAITTAINLKPFQGVETDTTADKACGFLGLECSRYAA